MYWIGEDVQFQIIVFDYAFRLVTSEFSNVNQRNLDRVFVFTFLDDEFFVIFKIETVVFHHRVGLFRAVVEIDDKLGGLGIQSEKRSYYECDKQQSALENAFHW